MIPGKTWKVLSLHLWYEHIYAENLSPFYLLLAYHWGQAQVVPKTLEYLEKAGELALHNGAYQETVDIFCQILALVDTYGQDYKLSDSKTNGIDKAMERQISSVFLLSGPAAQLRRARWERQLGQAYFGLGDLLRITSEAQIPTDSA